MLYPAAPVPTDILHLHNNHFTRETWGLGFRPDQRRADQVRPLSVEFTRGQVIKRLVASRDNEKEGSAGGSATSKEDSGLDASCLASRQNSTRVDVKLGMTHLTASIHCHLVEPLPNKAKHGFFDINVQYMGNERSGSPGELSPNSNLFPSSVASLQRFLLSLFKEGVVDTEGLCVVPGRHVWSLSIHCCIWNNDGNVVDACELAVLGLLLAHRRPEAVVIRSAATARGEKGNQGEEGIRLMEEWEREPVPLSLLHTPLSCSFILTKNPFVSSFSERKMSPTGMGSEDRRMEDCERILADPTMEESAAAATSVTVVVNRECQVCGVFKGGGAPVGIEHILECFHMAMRNHRGRDIHTNVDDKIFSSSSTRGMSKPSSPPRRNEGSSGSGNEGKGKIEEEVGSELGGIAAYWWSVIDRAVKKLDVERQQSRYSSFQWAKQRTGVAAAPSPTTVANVLLSPHTSSTAPEDTNDHNSAERTTETSRSTSKSINGDNSSGEDGNSLPSSPQMERSRKRSRMT